jgi:hypothetical protein
METSSTTSATSAGVAVVNTVATGTTALKQVQNKMPIAMIATKPGTSTIRGSPVPMTFLSQNHIPIASASTVTPATVAGGVNPTYIIVTNQPTNGQS